MGYFFEQCEVINRTSKVLSCRFDGQDIELLPNYTPDGKRIEDVHNILPAIAAPYARSQNVRMGSEDPLDPTSYEVLVGVLAKKGAKQRDDITFLEQDETVLTRVKLEDLLDGDPSVKEIRVAGKRNQARAKRTEADVPSGVDAATFRRM